MSTGNAVWVIISIPTPERERQLCETGRPETSSEGNESGHNSVESQGTDSPALRRGASYAASLKKTLEDAFEEVAIVEAVWYLTKNGKGYQIYFPVEQESSDQILDFFCSKGIGTQKDTFIGMIPFTLFYREEEYPAVFDDVPMQAEEKSGVPNKLFSFKSIQEKFLKSITARLTVAQVVECVRSGSELTFDFLLYTILAAWIAAMGLLDNSVVNTVASMLVSPLMGPVMAMTFGTIVKNKELRDMGIRNAIIGFLVCVIFGYVFGLLVFNFTQDWNPNVVWPTTEMQTRGQARVLWIGMLVALPSGAAVALSLLSGNQSSLVGVAISASLLPPCVNAGLLWAFATIKGFKAIGQDEVLTEFPDCGWIFMKPAYLPPEGYTVNYTHNMAIECFYMGLVSLGLVTVNVVCIIIMAYTLLKIKEVTPLTGMSSATSRFWKEDVKLAREFKGRSISEANVDTLGEEFLREWATMVGLDEKEFLSDTPQAKAARVQTLRDMLQDVGSDEVFREITRSAQFPRASLHPDLYAAYESDEMVNPVAGARRASMQTEAMRRASRQYQARRTSAFFPSSAGQLPMDMQRRRSSALLRKSLLTTDHLPFSMWPQARTRSDSRFQVTPVATDPQAGRGQASVTIGRGRPSSRLPSTEEADLKLE